MSYNTEPKNILTKTIRIAITNFLRAFNRTDELDRVILFVGFAKYGLFGTKTFSFIKECGNGSVHSLCLNIYI